LHLMEEIQVERARRAFANYQDDCVNRLSYQQMALSRASLKQKTALLKSGFGEYLTSLLNCIEANQNVLNDMLESASMQFGSGSGAMEESGMESEDEMADSSRLKRTPRMDHLRVNGTLLSLAREWSVDGAEERSAVYDPIFKELEERLPQVESAAAATVLVPASGTARLPFEIAIRFAGRVQVVANESNVSLLFGANFVFHKCERIANYRVYPYVSDLTDRVTSQSVTNPVSFPDIDVTERPEPFRFRMVPGEFEELVGSRGGSEAGTAALEEESVDFVVTCLTLDAAQNVVNHVEKVWQVLRPGGFWIGLTDLGCRYERSAAAADESPPHLAASQPLVRLPWTTIKQVITDDFKFKLVKEEMLQLKYFFQGASMRDNLLKCPFFVCQK